VGFEPAIAGFWGYGHLRNRIAKENRRKCL